MWQLTEAVCGELSDSPTHRTAVFVLPTLQRVFSGWVGSTLMMASGHATYRWKRLNEAHLVPTFHSEVGCGQHQPF